MSPKRKTTKKSNGANSEVAEVARELAALALAQRQQGGKLKVRQKEQLRRALAAAAPSMGWEVLAATSNDPVAKAKRDLKKLVKRGTKSMSQDLSDQLADKKAEVKELKKVASSLEKLAKKKDEFPSEVTYLHTARNGSAGFVTKTETVVLAAPSEALDVAQKIEKRLDTWGKHRDQMLEELKHQQKLIDEMREEVGTFVESSQRMLGEVVTTLY